MGIICSTTSPPSGDFPSQGFGSSNSTPDPTLGDEYFTFTVTSEAGWTLQFDTSDELSFSALEVGGGPGQVAVFFSTDGGATWTQLGNSEGIGTSAATLNFSFASSPSSLSSIVFRVFGFDAPFQSGALVVDDVQLTGEAFNPLLPVELTAFDALVDGRDVLLTWTTASETNNAGFEVQRMTAASAGAQRASWEVLGFVDGHGTTLDPQHYRYRIEDHAPGRYVFRFKQIDYDGAFEYSPEVDVQVGVAGPYHLSSAHPNPFNPTTRFTLTVARRQRVHVAVYDVLGRRVALLYEGALSADVTHSFRFEAGHLPGGVYHIRATGEAFTTTRSVMLVK